jgi:hypothetical protein
MSINGPSGTPENIIKRGNESLSKVETLDISKGWDNVSYWKIIKKKIRSLDVKIGDVLVRGIDPKNIDNINKFGSDLGNNEIIWGSTAKNIEDKYGEDENALNYAFDNVVNSTEDPVLAIYDLNFLLQDNSMIHGVYGYKPKIGKTLKDALVKVYILKF